MKIFDPTNIAPYNLASMPASIAGPLIANRNAARARSQHRLAPMTPKQEAGFIKNAETDLADMEWLSLNLPMGTVFGVLGVTHMVTSLPFYNDDPKSQGPKPPEPLRVRVVRPNGKGGIDEVLMSCLQLRTMLEPEFTHSRLPGTIAP